MILQEYLLLFSGIISGDWIDSCVDVGVGFIFSSWIGVGVGFICSSLTWFGVRVRFVSSFFWRALAHNIYINENDKYI